MEDCFDSLLPELNAGKVQVCGNHGLDFVVTNASNILVVFGNSAFKRSRFFLKT